MDIIDASNVTDIVFQLKWKSENASHKVVHIWERIHEFEGIGLVMEYFLKSNGFDDLGTYSMRGLPRPRDDKYAGAQSFSDPVYAVWGSRTRG